MLDVWYVKTADVAPEPLREACARTMSEAERARGERFVFPERRHEHLVTRALCRIVLAKYTGMKPHELAFVENEFGKPMLVEAGDLRFNLSNTKHLLVCVVTRGTDIGVDAEPLARADDVLEIADAVFTTTERAELANEDERERRTMAIRRWTAKEAYMKARGLGLSLPPKSFRMHLGEDGHGHVDADPRWRLVSLELEGHIVSICCAVATDPRTPVLHAARATELYAHSR